MSRKIYLVRHGKIDIGDKKRYIGISDVPLNKDGILQAKKLKEILYSIELEKAYLSPLVRCVETANIILQNRNVEKVLLKELMEINMGKWEGKTFDYIKSYFPEQFKERGKNIDSFVPEGGESFNNVRERVKPVLESIIKNTHGNILIIAHAGVNRVIISTILSLPLKCMFDIEQNYGCINEFSWDIENEKWKWRKLL
ncbi:phosphoglycerate mutase [Clostridium carboxidivorans P7]|uniref:Alpha-ribazole phosphatase n=1 Tax=Clostridium carboxidivorans P7 TaxID=536227 RepID=C6PY18_9CLOT|nr:alpha-ribazole phosphatase [Clostridium carboxidivorans]AKN33880.1 phosphoglycerate mutase [Clostridium carboxidivorans P7]EET85853.1 Phosphoglycerate mutase [Clostridium carboxidivorans P7]EFG86505.1 phosphoglycerate mutase family protein [Clostridium carboxidivorans P7]